MKFRFFWKDGTVSTGEGERSTDAFTKLGYGKGAVEALDYWEEVDEPLPFPDGHKAV